MLVASAFLYACGSFSSHANGFLFRLKLGLVREVPLIPKISGLLLADSTPGIVGVPL